MTIVCKEEDDYVRERPRWVAELSNGETIYQDDDRPGVVLPGAWLRLKDYLQENHLSIRQLWLQFRTNRIQIGEPNAAGYLLARMAFGIMSSDGEMEQFDGLVVGVYIEKSDDIWAYTFKLPELSLVHFPEKRPFDPHAANFIDNRTIAA